MNGPILEHHQEKGLTVNGVRYSAMLEEKLKPAIHSRRRGLLSEGALLLHDNARPHTAAATVTTIHPQSTIMCLARLRKHCEDEDFTATTRSRRRCISGFDNSKTLLLVGYRSLSKDVKSALH
jgi:hypothetical protein